MPEREVRWSCPWCTAGGTEPTDAEAARARAEHMIECPKGPS